MSKRRIEVFSAGCPMCEEVIERARKAACPSCEVEVEDMNEPAAAARARTWPL